MGVGDWTQGLWGNVLGVWGSVGQRLHGELAEGAEHQEGVLLEDVGEPDGGLAPLQGLCVLGEHTHTHTHLIQI